MQVSLRHRHTELVAAKPAAHVGGTDHPLKLLCDEPERRIAGAVALAVVDLLQVVDVDHHHGQLASVPFRQRDLALDHTLELATVREACEVIRTSLVGELARAIQRDCDLVRHRGHEE